MLERLRTFDADRPMELDELVGLSAYGRQLTNEYQVQSIPPPVWLADKMEALGRTIASLQREAWAKSLKETEFELERLKTADEKRHEARARAAELRAKLGMGPSPVPNASAGQG